MSRRERACPQCQGTLHDLTRASDRRSAIRLFTPSLARRPGLAWVRERLPKLLVSGGFVTAAVFVAVTDAMTGAFWALLLAAAWVFSASPHRPRTDTRTTRPKMLPPRAARKIALLPEGRPPDGPVVVRGTVRVLEPITSPLAGTPCAAWRVVGSSSKEMIDDAQATTFDVIGDSAGTVRVDLGTALVLVETRKVPGVPDEATRAWLAERVIDVEHASLEEGVLVDGDRVLVCARDFLEEPGTAPRGFRDAERIRVVAGTAQHPLRIERL